MICCLMADADDKGVGSAIGIVKLEGSERLAC